MTKWLQLSGNPMQIQMPNEIFTDLTSANFKSWKHKAFAYSYYFLVTYLYRTTLYGTTPEDYCQDSIMKKIVARKSSFDYVTKKNGVLDKMGYTKSTSNYPISFYMKDGILEFGMIKDLKKQVDAYTPTMGNRFAVKEPVKALNRFNEDYSGTFYDMQNTHLVTVQRFVDIITHPDLGYVGLYVYAYLSMMGDKFRDGYQISNKALSDVIGCNEKTLSKYTRKLEECGFIKSERKYYEYKLLEKKYSIVDKHDNRRKKL